MHFSEFNRSDSFWWLVDPEHQFPDRKPCPYTLVDPRSYTLVASRELILDTFPLEPRFPFLMLYLLIKYEIDKETHKEAQEETYRRSCEFGIVFFSSLISDFFIISHIVP